MHSFISAVYPDSLDALSYLHDTFPVAAAHIDGENFYINP
jgi:hypothetical protein